MNNFTSNRKTGDAPNGIVANAVPIATAQLDYVSASMGATHLERRNEASELLKASEAIRHSEIRFRRIFEAAQDGIIMLDPVSRKITDANPFIARLLGYTREELLGKELWEIGLLADEKDSQQAFRDLQMNGFIRYEDLPLETKTGERREVEFVSHLYDEGDLKVIQCNIRDITIRKRIEAALSHSEERYRTLFELGPVGVYCCGVDGLIKEYNVRATELWGRSPEPDDTDERFCGSFKLYRPDGSFLAHGDTPVADVLSGKIALVSDAEVVIERPDGTKITAIANIAPLKDEKGEIVGMINCFYDISERKRTNTALHLAIDNLNVAQAITKRASAAKDDFLAALSHELRTPLTPVLLAATALREDPRLPADVREQLGMMERNIALEARLIDDLLDLTMIERGKLQLRSQRCDAHSLIGLAIDIVREDARTKAISIEREFVAVRSGLTLDPARFQQVIWNLLRNAVKFTPQNGRIVIRTADEPASDGSMGLRIEIADSGIGIEPVMLERIFLPFDQGNLVGTHRFGGLGLGLAIARAVVGLHGGRISAHSKGPSQGSTFAIEFPGSFEPQSGVTNPGVPFDGGLLSPKAASAVAPLRLLLVEDHPSTLKVMSKLLQGEGHRVIPVGTIIEALAAAAENKFDLVISDLGLPDGSGNELMEKLRDAYGLRGIALSGYGTEEDLVRSTKAGFVSHLVKPIAIAELRRVIAELPRA